MFKMYKGIFKSLRDMQDQLWQQSAASFPDFTFPRHLNTWQLQTLESMSNWAEKAVGQSLEMQRGWLDQWSGRAESKKLKPKFFADLNAEARESMQRWMENQNELWDQWLQVVRSSVGPEALPDLEEWDKAIQESIQGQMELLREWSELADFDNLSAKELTKLSEQISKSMKKSIGTQQQLWSHWFKDLGNPLEMAGLAAAEMAEPKPMQPKATRAAKDVKASQSGAADDLKRISGIGPGLEQKLKNEGIATIDQIAKLTDEDIHRLEEHIIRFPGRIRREKWVEQAKALSSAT